MDLSGTPDMGRYPGREAAADIPADIRAGDVAFAAVLRVFVARLAGTVAIKHDGGVGLHMFDTTVPEGAIEHDDC